MHFEAQTTYESEVLLQEKNFKNQGKYLNFLSFPSGLWKEQIVIKDN